MTSELNCDNFFNKYYWEAWQISAKNKNKCNFKKVLVHVNMQHVRNVKDAWLRQIARLEFLPEDGAVASRRKNALFVRKLSIFCFKYVCRFDLIFLHSFLFRRCRCETKLKMIFGNCLGKPRSVFRCLQNVWIFF